jgi:hypothetical protein
LPSAARAHDAAAPDRELDADASADRPDAKADDAAILDATAASAHAPVPASSRASEPVARPKHRRARARSQAPRKSRSAAPAAAPSSDESALRDFIPPSRRKDG